MGKYESIINKDGSSYDIGNNGNVEMFMGYMWELASKYGDMPSGL
jgi:hypothetical protein